MARDHAGFDPDAMVRGLVEWTVDHYPRASSVAGRDFPVAERLLRKHFRLHGGPTLIARDGTLQPAPRCLHNPCLAAGVAFARMEVFWYFKNVAQERQARAFRDAASRLPGDDPTRLELEREASWRFDGLFSRCLPTNSHGRPSLLLARAICQHLWHSGFTYPEVGTFMGITPGAAEMRCRSPDVRSFIPYEQAQSLTGGDA